MPTPQSSSLAKKNTLQKKKTINSPSTDSSSQGQHLVIVESPAKCKTIGKYLGKNFTVMASFGHIAELAKKNMGVDIDKGFVPHYEIDPKKLKVVKELKQAMKKVDQVWIATDEDREGEAIGRHVAQQLKLDIATTPRITFHEITKPALEKAISTPRTLDMDLVNAQQARRILDRLVGFQLSPLLWKKVKTGLSAGRVQSVAVRLIVDREREIQSFDPQSRFQTKIVFSSKKNKFIAKADKDFVHEQEAIDYLHEVAKSDFLIESLQTKPGKKTPSAPFTTSTLQQEASRKLGFSVAQTMRVAQKLYEEGVITYMRTDSIIMSGTAIAGASKAIEQKFGSQNVKIRKRANKSASAQEAHECIRPTDFNKEFAGADSTEKKLYHLIRQRSLAAQMIDAEIEKTVVKISASHSKVGCTATGEVTTVPGFLQLYSSTEDDEDSEGEGDEQGLPPLQVGESISLLGAQSETLYDRRPSRYTEASLVKKLESEGIGRPSTYAPTIATILKRGYVELATREGEMKEFTTLSLDTQSKKQSETVGSYFLHKKSQSKPYGTDKKKLFPTDTGILVTDFLIKHFPDIVDYGFTAKVEKEFDEIASGSRDRKKMLSSFYTPFSALVVKSGGEDVERVSGERLLGKDPQTGKAVSVRLGRFGPLVQLGDTDDEDKKFSSLKPGLRLETITLEEALDCLKLPRDIGEYKGSRVTVAIGRFGPYLKYDKLFVSLPKEEDPYTIELSRAIELIEQKLQKEKDKIIMSFEYKGEKVSVENGQYGPFIRFGKKNIKIPAEMKKKDLKKITEKQRMKVIDGGR